MSQLLTSFSTRSLCAASKPQPPALQHRIQRTIKPTSIRHFTSSSAVYARINSKRKLAQVHATIPPYPHGAARLYKQSNFGLYGGTRIRFGNQVTKGRWVKKSRRTWKPNVVRAGLYSEGLDEKLKLKVATKVMRAIDKFGGVDEYVLGNKSGRIKKLGMKGWELRWRLLNQPHVRDK
ncbi:50S ribosomal protein L24, partial [Microthyrium microscopicum]